MTNVFHSGNATQDVPAGETPEQAAVREAVEARIKVGKPSPDPKEIVFDEDGVAHDLNAEAKEAERVAAEAAAAKPTTTTTKATTSSSSSSSSTA